MKVVRKFFMQNPFYRDDQKTKVTAILVSEFENGSSKKDTVEFEKYKSDGSMDPLWTKIMEEVGEKILTENTEERRLRKLQEHEQKQLKQQQEKQNNQMEKLFNIKLQIFEMPEIRNCQNRKLRSKLRASKNEFELNAYVTMILMESMNEKETTN